MTLPPFLFIVSAFFSLLSFFLNEPAPLPEPNPVLQVAAAPALPESASLEFVENKGQWPKKISYAAELPGGKLFLQSTGFLYVFQDPEVNTGHGHSLPAQKANQRNILPREKLRNHAYSVTFENANPSTPLQGQVATQGIRNYYLGNDPAQWGSNAKGFRQVQYQDLYKGVNLVLYEQKGNLKYDLNVAAGAATNQIKLRYAGTTKLFLQDGNLHVETSVGTVTELKPVAYQLIQHQRVPVPCQYQLNGQVLSFEFPNGYNTRVPLVIDPAVVFSSFTGSTADNWGFTATYDSKGNMYAGGIANAIGYPVSIGAYDMTYNNDWDIAIIKYNTQVTGPASRLYATYLGGSLTEVPHSLIVNAADELLVLGTTSSADYPTSGSAFSRSFKGGTALYPLGRGGAPSYLQGSDLVITRLNQTGNQLMASTFLGGSSNDGLLASNFAPELVQNYGDQFRGDIITDAAGNVYIASSTTSSDFPVANGLLSKMQTGGNDAIITKLSPNLDRLLWSTYYGGSEEEAAYSIQLDPDLNVYVCGGTTSPSLPGTSKGLHPAPAGNVDGFVLKLNASGSSVLAATFLGTSAYDQAYFLQLDEANQVYLFGQTQGAYPATAGRYRNNNGRQFLHKLTNDLSTTVWSTVFGAGRSTLDISPTAFLVDECQRIYISGWGGGTNTNSYSNGTTTGLPVTANALQRTTDGGDFYLMQLGPDANQLLYATFYGGNQLETGGSYEHVDGGTSRFDKKGYVYQAVCGGCQSRSNFPIPAGANFFSRTNNSENCNNAAFKLDFTEDLRASAGPNQQVCADEKPITLQGSPAGGVWTGTGITSTNGVYTFTPSTALAGNHTLTYTVTGTGSCAISRTMVMTVYATPPHSFNIPPLFCVNSGTSVTLTGFPAGGTFSGKGITGSTFNPALAGIGKHTITYTSNGTNGFCGTVSKEIEVIQLLPNIGSDTTLCPGSLTPFQLRASITGGTWSGKHVSASGLFTPPAVFEGAVDVTYSISSPCVVSVTKRIHLPPVPTMQAQLSNACTDNPAIAGYAPYNAAFSNTTTNATGFIWNFGDGSQSTEPTPRHLYKTPGKYQVTLVATYGKDCQETLEVGSVVVAPPFIPNIFTPNADGKNDTFVQHFSCFPTEIIVYNIWGKQVYQQKIYNQQWDGGSLSEGTYYYILQDTEGNSAKGWVEILR